MGTTYLSPGVYVEEVDSGPQPIQGVSTSITGAVGVTAFGPTTGKPVLVTSFADFTRNFGGFLPDPPSAIYNQWALDQVEGGEWWHFPLAVKGFFDNGGQQLFVKRVFAKTAAAATGVLGQGLVADVTMDAATAATIVQLSHGINVFETAKIQFYRGDTNAQIGGDFTVKTYVDNPTSCHVTLTAGLPQALVTARGDYATIHAIVAPGATPTFTFSANALGAWGKDLNVEVQPMVGNTFNILADTTAAGNISASTTISAAAAAGATTVTLADITNFSNGDHVLVSGQEYTITNKTPTTAPGGTFTVTPAVGAGGWSVGLAVKRMRTANAAGVATINVSGASSLYAKAIVELDNGHQKEAFTVVSTAGNALTLSANLANVYYEGHKLRLIEARVNVAYNPVGGTPASESFSNLRLVDDGTVNFLGNYVNQQSSYVTVTKGVGLSWSDLTKFPTATSGGWQPLSGGDDQLGALTVDDFVGVDGGSGARTGIQALEDITEVSICIVPGMWSTTVQSALINHCETLRYRFAILDPPDGLGIRE